MNARLSLIGLVVTLMLSWAPPSFGRWFDAERGQWLSRDQAGYVDGPNLYAYVQDNPITMRDPMGFGPEGPTYVPPHLPPFPPAPTGSCTVSLQCRPLLFGQYHCAIVVCCPDCVIYELRNPHGITNTEPHPYPVPGEEDFRWRGVWRDLNNRDLADCVKAVVQANQDNSTYPYNPFNCNSNWWLGSVLQCCLGSRPDKPDGAFGWDSCCNHMDHPIFVCPSGRPGGGPGQTYFSDCSKTTSQY